MKKFSLLRIVADVIEWLAYLELIGGLLLLIFVYGAKKNVMLVEVAGGAGAFVILWILVTLPTLVTAHLIKLGLAYYETSYTNLEVSRDILHELKSNRSEVETLKDIEFKAWKLKNPDKSINDFFAEKNT